MKNIMKNMNIKLAGAVTQFENIKSMYLTIRKLQALGYTFTVYDGTDLCEWNGGRVNTDITLTGEIVEWYNSRDIGIALTFTNPLIELANLLGNTLLDLLGNNPINTIILVNEELRKYVKDSYNYKIAYSFSGTARTTSDFKAIEDNFDILVPKIELIFDPRFYENVDLSKYEILLEEQCINCPILNEHHDQIALMNTMYKDPIKELGYEAYLAVNNCTLEDHNASNRKGQELISKENLKRLVDIGYTNLKVPGRELDSKVYKERIGTFLKALEDL